MTQTLLNITDQPQFGEDISLLDFLNSFFSQHLIVYLMILNMHIPINTYKQWDLCRVSVLSCSLRTAFFCPLSMQPKFKRSPKHNMAYPLSPPHVTFAHMVLFTHGAFLANDSLEVSSSQPAMCFPFEPRFTQKLILGDVSEPADVPCDLNKKKEIKLEGTNTKIKDYYIQF